MTGAAGTAIGSQALKEWSGQVYTASRGTVGFRLACWVQEKRSVGDKTHHLLSSNAYGNQQSEDHYSGEESAAGPLR
jgi:hypothetical protein